MAISDKINSIKTHIGEAYTAIQGKEGTVPANKNCENLKDAIASIPTSGKTQEKTVNITENGVIITTPDTGYDGMSSVTTVTNVQPDLQEKAVTPSETQQTATPDAGYDGLSKVTVGAIQTKETSVTPAKGQQVLEVTDNKYYKKVTVEAIPDDYVIPSGTVQITENGIVDVSGKANANVNVPSKEEEAKTVDLAMASGNQTITPTSGKVLSQVVVKKPATMLPENIKKNVNIGGVTGTLEPQKEEEAGTATITENGSQTFSPTSGKVFSDFTVTTNVPTGVDISDTTAVASDVRKGKDFYSSDGTKTQGIIENYGGASLSMSTAVLTKGQYGMSAAAIGNKIYLHGQNKNYELFDTETNTHSLLNAVTDYSTFYAPIAAVNKKIYLVASLSKISIFNPETDSSDVVRLSTSLESNCSGANVGNNIYFFGGSTFKTGTTINIYNISNNTLSKSSVALPVSASGIAACAINDKIYLFGGHNTDTSAGIYGTFLDSINVFDTTNNTISTLDVKLPVKMMNIGIAAMDTKIYLFGGSSANYEYHNTIYEFDTLTNVIKKLDIELPEKMHGIAAATVNDKIYLFGGQGSSGIKNFIQIFSPKTSVLITSKDGETLPTNGKYCVSDITVQPALEIKTVTENGVILPSGDYCGFEKVTVNVQTTPKLQTKTVTPTKSQQSVSPDSGYDGLSSVTVNAIPADYIIPSGSQNITTNGTYDIKEKASVVVAVPSSQPTLNAPTIAINDKTLTITNPASNGNFVTKFKVFSNGAALTEAVIKGSTTTVDLSTLITEVGTYSITTKASAANFNDSAASSAVSYEVAAAGYNVTVTAENYDFNIYDGQSASGTKLGSLNGGGDSITVVCTSGYLYFSTSAAYGNITSVTGGVTIVNDYTVKVTGDGTVSANYMCMIEGTQITLADGTTKAIEDITYDDELLVWNFYAGRFDKAKPTWIKVAEVAPRYNLVKFSNGSEVGFVGAGGEKGYHRIFNKEAGAFTYTGNFKETPNGTTTFAQDGTFPTVVSQEVVEKEVKFYNVITDKHYNLFANGILTSCKLSNKYHIENMRYIGEKLINEEEEKVIWEEKNKLRK